MPYKKNFLTKVIFQLRFDPIISVESEGPDCFQEKICGEWPRTKEMKELQVEASLEKDKPVRTEVKSVKRRWVFASQDGRKTLTVGSDIFSLEYGKYENIGATKGDFEFLWGHFTECYTLSELSRVGLRYINEIVLPTGDPLDWAGYIADEVLGATLKGWEAEQLRLARSFHELHLVAEDYRLAFKFGIMNSDFPNPIAKREFILDYDCVSLGPVESSRVPGCLVAYNEVIGNRFERSIGSRLREEMSP